MSLRDPNRQPTHPGATLREDVLPELGISQSELARRLGVGRLSVNELLNEKRACSPEMAARLGKLLGTSPESWLDMQAALDLWKVQQDPEKLEGITPLRVA